MQQRENVFPNYYYKKSMVSMVVLKTIPVLKIDYTCYKNNI